MPAGAPDVRGRALQEDSDKLTVKESCQLLVPGGAFDPADHFFHALAAALADLISDMACVVRLSTAVLRGLPVLLRCRSNAMCGVTDL